MADDLEDDQWLYGDSSEDKAGESAEIPQDEPAESEQEETPVTQSPPTVVF